MPTFDVDREEITAFELDGRYIFKQYFDNDDRSQELEQYYNADRYRLEIPEGKLSEVRQVLDNYFYELVIEDSPEEYCVVAGEETDTNTILRSSVMSKQHRNHGIY